ncbi:unnamed protein product [Amoebophrya sp. A120]|nr:unnamed protein product [Amoebophrya sp. A120]|eukprot:GSA120T00025216001.1
MNSQMKKMRQMKLLKDLRRTLKADDAAAKRQKKRVQERESRQLQERPASVSSGVGVRSGEETAAAAVVAEQKLAQKQGKLVPSQALHTTSSAGKKTDEVLEQPTDCEGRKSSGKEQSEQTSYQKIGAKNPPRGSSDAVGDKNSANYAKNDRAASSRSKPESQRGSCFLVKTMVSDEWQTCPSAWQQVTDQVLVKSAKFSNKKALRIWQPFYYDGKCAEHLKKFCGFPNVHHKPGEDFFEKVKEEKFLRTVDLIWDNPPYTNPEMKQKVLRALVASGKPFCMLLPVAILHAAFVREIISDMSQVQVLLPRRVWVRKKNQNPVPFKLLLWFCYKMDLPKDLYFLEDVEEK